jgi:uncharacterized membrane protein YccC
VSATLKPPLPPARWPWLAELVAGEWRAWLFVAKSLLAFYLAGWLAMWLKLEQPATSMITVALVLHPQSGMVLAKSFYRAIGTVVGSVAGLALLAAFPQQRELFLLSLSLWVALCAGGAMLYRNFMAYGFVLSGYTAALVALPAIGQPLGVFDGAVMRVSEVLLGVAVSGLVSDLVLPERLRLVLRQSARAHFGKFIAFVAGSTGGSVPRPAMENAHLAFVRAAVQLEDLRASVIFEDPEMHARSSRMRLLNQRYMAAATSFQSLHHLINRMQRGGRDAVVDALVDLYHPLGQALAPPDPAPGSEPEILAPRLEACARAQPGHAAILRAGLPDAEAMLEFDTGAALLRRLTDELYEFISCEASLRSGMPPRGSVERVHFRRSSDWPSVGLTTLRTFLTMGVLGTFWFASGWTEGANAMLLATVFSGLVAAAPNPVAAVTYTLYGFAAGLAAAFVALFWLLPGSDGFAMFVAATLPLLLLGPYLSTRASLPGVGTGYALAFVLTLALKNVMVYDPVRYFNDAIGELSGLALSGVAFMLLPGLAATGWHQARRLRQLRELVCFAASAPLPGLVSHFESLCRDLLLQAVTQTRAGSDASRRLLAWALAVQEGGRTVIELRQDAAAGDLDADARAAIDAAVRAVARLYRQVDSEYWQQANHLVDLAIAAAARAPAVRNHLYQLRGALRDDESPLAGCIPPTPAMEPAHAA